MLAMVLTVAASIIYTALYFRYSVRSMMVGVVGFLNQAVYTVVNMLMLWNTCCNIYDRALSYKQFYHTFTLFVNSQLG